MRKGNCCTRISHERSHRHLARAVAPRAHRRGQRRGRRGRGGQQGPPRGGTGGSQATKREYARAQLLTLSNLTLRSAAADEGYDETSQTPSQAPLQVLHHHHHHYHANDLSVWLVSS